ncbi:MAG: hypothetical protein HOU81_16455, partial [Hamadaea sp.]|nr:hypothetical protein [Hamadaea sp.]
KPLKEALDWLAGNPDEISAHAQTWENVAKFTLDAQKYYADALRVETADWLGDSGDAYRGHASGHLSVMEGISKAAHGIHYAVMGAGLIVGLVRGIVRDLIAQFIGTLAARLPQWLAEAGLTLGLATPVVIGQVVSLVTTWVNKIQKFVRALLSSLKKLTPMVKKLGEILEQLKELLKKLGRSNPLTRSADGPPPLKPGEIPGPRTSPANGPLAGRELDPHYRGETDPFTASNLFGRPSNGVRYFDEAGREQFRLVVDNQGRLRNASDGSLFDTTSGVSAHNGGGRAVFVMDQNGNLFASNYHGVGDFHHSSFLAGGDVASAGELTVRNGVLEGMNNSSGHYKPTQGHHAQARDELLAQGVQPGPNGLTEDLW